MSRFRKRLIAVLAASFVAVSLTPAPAQAAVRVVYDKARDTTAPNDVTRIRVSNGDNRMRIAVRYRNLGDGHISAGIKIDTRKRGGEYYTIGRHQNFEGEWVSSMVHYRPGKGFDNVRCKARDVVYQPGPKSRIVFRFAQRCLGADTGDALFRYHGSNHEGSGPPKPEHAPKSRFLVKQG